MSTNRAQQGMILVMLLLMGSFAAVGCGGASNQDEPAAEAVEEASDAMGEMSEMADEAADAGMQLVEKAARIARELQAAPERAEEILKENDLDADSWSALLNDIAKDPRLSAAYQEAMGD